VCIYAYGGGARTSFFLFLAWLPHNTLNFPLLVASLSIASDHHLPYEFCKKLATVGAILGELLYYVQRE
jgi:hypothetical protein